MHWDRATLTIFGTDIDPSQGEERLALIFGAVDDSEVAAVLEAVLSDGPYADAPPPYHVDRRERITEWGASGAVVDIVLSVPTEMVAAVVTYVLTRILGRETTVLLDESEAIEDAKFCIATRYATDREHLEVTRYEERDTKNIVTIVDEEREYTVTLMTSKRRRNTTAAMTWKVAGS